MKIASLYVLFLIVFLTSGRCLGQDSSFHIIDKPIVFDEERKQLSLDYLAKRHGVQQTEPYIKPKMIVLHWTVIPTLDSTFATFNPSVLAGRANLQTASRLNTSVAYVVDRDGTIYRLLPDSTFTRHCIGLNYCSIGVENIGNNDLTEAQIKANIQLVRYLKSQYKDIEYLIGHYEYQDFIGTPLWKETNPDYLTKKIDPGPYFMHEVRSKLKDLHLKGSPRQTD